MTTTRERGRREGEGEPGAGVAADEAARGQEPDRLPRESTVNEEDDSGDAVDDHRQHGA